MAGGYGLQFQPGVPQNGNGVGDKTRGRVQEPVQVLSTRLPKIFGAGAIAPPGLLNAPGGMGMPGAQSNVVAQALAQLAGLPPGMAMGSSDGRTGLPPRMGSGGAPPPVAGLPAGIGMGGGPGLLPPSPTPLPSPPPIFMPPPYSPPPPRITPGDRPGHPPPIIRPEPGPPGPPPEIIEEPSPGGYGDWARHERELNGRPSFNLRGDDDQGIQSLARLLFRNL
jgi:hypothetical protein